MACGPGGPARGGEGADAAQRRAGADAAGATLGSDRQGVPLRDRGGHGVPRRYLQGTLAAPRLSLHVRARVHRWVSCLLGDRRWFRRLRRPSREPRRPPLRRVASTAREAAGVQAADGVELPVGVVVRERLQLRLPGRVHRGAAAVGSPRVQLPRERREAVARGRQRGPARRVGSHDRHGLGDLHAGGSWYERVRSRGWLRVPHLLSLRAGRGRALGHVPVARPGTARAKRDGDPGPLVPSARRVRQRVTRRAWLRHRWHRRTPSGRHRCDVRYRLTYAGLARGCSNPPSDTHPLSSNEAPDPQAMRLPLGWWSGSLLEAADYLRKNTGWQE